MWAQRMKQIHQPEIFSQFEPVVEEIEDRLSAEMIFKLELVCGYKINYHVTFLVFEAIEQGFVQQEHLDYSAAQLIFDATSTISWDWLKE